MNATPEVTAPASRTRSTDRRAVLASALLHVLVLLLLLLRLPDALEDGAGGLAVDIVYDVPGDGTKGDGEDAAAEAAPLSEDVAEDAEEAPQPPPPSALSMAEPVTETPAEETRPIPEEPVTEVPAPEEPVPEEPMVAAEPEPEPPSDVPLPVALKPPVPATKPTPPAVARAEPTPPTPPAPPRPSAPTPTTALLVPGNGSGAVTTGQGRGTAAGADDPNAAAGELAGDGGVLGNGVPRAARGTDLGAADLTNRLIGNTLSGMMGSRDGAEGRFDVEWQAYVRADGKVIARVRYKALDKRGEMKERVVTEDGHWTLENGLMCLKFGEKIDFGAKDCFHVQDVDRKLAFYYASCPYHASDRCNSGRLGQFGEVLPGNAFGL
ncbi:hypothetical protein L2U69_12235 [Zavarzinia compransoris]|nr:hypothetical protein [Zavarzinia marina]